METFLQDLRTKAESLDGDIFELLFTLSGKKVRAVLLDNPLLF